MNKMERKTWREFQAHGLLWFVNSILHAFGWAIVIEVNDFNNIVDVYPARVKFRGFSQETNTKNYKRLAEYMNSKSSELLEDFKDHTEIE